MIAVIMHFHKRLFKEDYLNRDSKTLWLTGILLYLPMLGFLIYRSHPAVGMERLLVHGDDP